MDEKIIRLMIDTGANGVWIFFIYEVLDFLKLAICIGGLGYGVKWLYEKATKDLN